MNAVEIEEAVSRLAGAPFDPADFPFAFLEAFGNKPTTLKKLKSGSSNQSVTRDREDFIGSNLPIYSPTELLNQL